MVAKLHKHCYGKHQVRVSKVRRPRLAAPRDETHELVEVAVDLELLGSFEASYLKGDNRQVIATDTCKNTVYVLAQDDPLDSIEGFGLTIARHFIKQYKHVDLSRVSLRERVWDRLLDSPHSFVASGASTPTAVVEVGRNNSASVTAGVEGLLVAKTTETGFANFHQDQYRTLADTDDRVLATQIASTWQYEGVISDFAAARQSVVDTLLKRFVDHYSRSVQETLFLMGEAVLERCDGVKEITITLPNKHHILFDLTPFGRKNENEVFVVTDEPYGYITATVRR